MIYYNLWSGKLKKLLCVDDLLMRSVWCVAAGLMTIISICGACEHCELPLGWLHDYPYVMTWSSLCRSHDNLSCNICENEIVIWNDFACPCLHEWCLELHLAGWLL